MLFLLAAVNAMAAKTIPSFTEKSVTGDGVIDSASYEGKVLLVNFWATWCPPCRKEIPALIKIQEKYADQGFSVIGISMDQGGKRVVRKFLEKMKVNYPNIVGNNKIAKGFGGVVGIPVSFMIDREGNLVKRYDGYVSEKVLVRELEELLAGAPTE